MAVREDGRATRVSAPHRFFPATPIVASGFRPSIAIRVTLAAGQRVDVTRTAAAPLALVVPEVSARAGTRAVFQTRAARPLAFVAWQLAEDVTAVGPSAGHIYSSIDPQRIYTLAIGEDGSTGRSATAVKVRTRSDFGCSAAKLPNTGFVWTIALVGLIVRRRRHSEYDGSPRSFAA